MSLPRRFSLAVETDPAPTDTTSLAQDPKDLANGPISAFLVDSRPQMQRRASHQPESLVGDNGDGAAPRRYSICDLTNFHGPGDAGVSAPTTTPRVSVEPWMLTTGRNHQRCNSTAIRFLVPKAASDVDC